MDPNLRQIRTATGSDERYFRKAVEFCFINKVIKTILINKSVIDYKHNICLYLQFIKAKIVL